jgi:hypothetical protein
MTPARIVRTGGPSGELELSPLELLCFVLGESLPEANRACLLCSVQKLIVFSNPWNLLAKGLQCLQCKISSVTSEKTAKVFLAKSLNMNAQVQVAVHKFYTSKMIVQTNPSYAMRMHTKWTFDFCYINHCLVPVSSKERAFDAKLLSNLTDLFTLPQMYKQEYEKLRMCK